MLAVSEPNRLGCEWDNKRVGLTRTACRLASIVCILS